MFRTATTFIRHGLYLLLIALPGPVLAGEARAIVATAAADGSVTLLAERFRTTFEDGTAATISVRVVDGYLHVTRKGYESGACRLQSTALVDGSGTPIVAGATTPGQTLYIQNNQPVILQRCEDSGCSAKKRTLPSGSPFENVARCDVTPLSGQTCACHEIDQAKQQIRVLDNQALCTSVNVQRELDISEWVYDEHVLLCEVRPYILHCF